MARLYVFECTCGKHTSVEKVEYTPPSNSIEISPGRYKIDLSQPDNHNGYPDHHITCNSCGKTITGNQFEESTIPPVYFNYMGDDD
jgi:hypothetical protein